MLMRRLSVVLGLILCLTVSGPLTVLARWDQGAAPGFLLIEIDGLSQPRLRQAIEEGTMPFLGSLISSGSHVLDGWETLGSSTTPVSQAGILHGHSAGVVGYRWWDREHGRLVEASDSGDARSIERAASGPGDLLADDGASITNIVSGGADRTMLTVSHLDTAGLVGDTAEHLLDPPRAVGFLAALSDELGTNARHWLRRDSAPIEPSAKRKVAVPIVGPALESALIAVTSMAVVSEIQRGTPILYASLVSYDEVAHYAGPDHVVAVDSLARIDRAIGTIAVAAEAAPRPYHLIVLSDHGQTPGPPFAERYGATLYEVVADVLPAGHDPIMAASGNLAHVYLERSGARLDGEAIESRAPGLTTALAEHPGIGVVVTRDQQGHLLATGPAGSRDLAGGRVAGLDPLEPYGPHAAESLRHIASPEHAGDLVIVSTYDPVADEVASFERQVSSHGGLGGPQTQAVFVYPADLEPVGESLELLGAEAVHTKLREWMSTGVQDS